MGFDLRQASQKTDEQGQEDLGLAGEHGETPEMIVSYNSSPQKLFGFTI